MTDRCDRTDLLVTECAHCLGHKLEVPIIYRAGYPFDAQFPGQCALCKGPFQVGERISSIRNGKKPMKGYAHARGGCQEKPS